LAAGLCPDLLGELKHSPRSPATMRGLLLRGRGEGKQGKGGQGRGGRGREKGERERGRKGRACLSFKNSGYGPATTLVADSRPY